MTWRSAASAVAQVATRNVWGEPVVYGFAVGGTAAITAVFDAAHAEALTDPESGGYASVGPMLRVRLGDLTAEPVQGDTWTLANGDRFEIVRTQVDGHGLVQCFGMEL